MNTLYLNHNGFSQFCKGSDENKTKTFPFNFLRLPPAPPAVLKGKVRKFLVLVRDWKEREALVVSITAKSERTIWFKVTTRSASAKLIKILRILLVQCSNFVQETPHSHKKRGYAIAYSFLCELLRKEW